MMYLLLIVFLLSVATTYFIKCYASNNLLDIPNQRSSHTIATPKGGGLAIVFSFFFAIFILFFTEQINSNYFYLLNLGLLVAGIGWWDDHQPIHAKWRFLVHVLVALSGLVILGGFPLVMIGESSIDLGMAGFVFGVVMLVWFLNLYNFMDGIDGLAASETIFVGSALAWFLYDISLPLSFVTLILVFSCLGFLLWNWPVAKIFMGDVGSGFLGLTLGFIMLMASQLADIFFVISIILSAVFIVDATYTLGYRFVTQQKWYDAHCSHAYQKAAKQYGHLNTLKAVWGINMFWLLPIAYCVYLNPAINIIASIIAYLPLIFLAFRFNAGTIEPVVVK